MSDLSLRCSHWNLSLPNISVGNIKYVNMLANIKQARNLSLSPRTMGAAWITPKCPELSFFPKQTPPNSLLVHGSRIQPNCPQPHRDLRWILAETVPHTKLKVEHCGQPSVSAQPVPWSCLLTYVCQERTHSWGAAGADVLQEGDRVGSWGSPLQWQHHHWPATVSQHLSRARLVTATASRARAWEHKLQEACRHS